MSNVNTLPVASYFLGLAPTLFTVDVATPPADFDIYCFFDSPSSMAGILTDSSVSLTDISAFSIDTATSDLIVASGGAAPNADEATLFINAAVPETWTMQVIVRADSLPVDFSNLVNEHLYFGTVDSVGPAAGLFLSSVGLAYAPLIDPTDADLTLVGPFQPIPGTAGLFVNGVSYTFRIATDLPTRTTYIFATPTSDVPFIGHRLVAVLPAVLTTETVPPALLADILDGSVLSVRGTAARGVVAAFDQVCLAAGLVMPNVPPRADAGRDQAIRACTVGMLDGTASFDPEGGSITYQWRLVDAPLTSSFAFEGSDGFTLPMVSPTGFSNKFYSAELGSVAADDDVVAGDALLVGGNAFTVVATGVDGHGYYVQFAAQVVVDNLINATFKLLRVRAISNADTAKPTFLPDVPGIYRFDLTVFDGQYLSEPSITIVNVLESQVPRGCIPDLGFVWSYLSDFWNLVEDRERIQVFWESLAQVTASELLNLWQTDYSKSLRDIQRHFQRRWLHYDLKLAEPIPELTTLRQVRGVVRSVDISPSGVSGVHGTVLVISSPLHATLTIQFPLPNPYFAADLKAFILAKLLGVDTRYEVVTQTDTAGQLSVQIFAPFPFAVAAGSTLPLFSVGQTNGAPVGAIGQRLTPRVYKTDHSLLNTDVRPGDVLVVSGLGYVISRVVDDPTDEERFQRVVVQDDLPIVLSNVWTIAGTVSSKLLNFYDGQVSAGDVVVFEVLSSADNTVKLVTARASGACASVVSQLSVDLTPLDAYLAQPALFAVFLAYVVRRARLPVGSLVTDIPLLQENIKETDDSVVLRRNVDYFLETSRGANSIRFVAGNAGDAGDVWEGAVPPDRLWAETTYLDNSPTIEANFGIPAELTVEQLSDIGTDTDYLSAVRGLWYTLINGPTLFNLRAGTQILLGLPFAEENGFIVEIRTDFSPTQGRVLVQDAANTAIVRSYSFPKALKLEVNPATKAVYVEGDAVVQFAPLVEGAEVIDYLKDPTWFQGILSQGVFFEVEKFHRFLVRVDSNAFNLSALLFVQNFILRVKPTYTRPMFVVQAQVGDTEISVTDEVNCSGTLHLFDGACFPDQGSATMFDQWRAAGGKVRNQFDTTSDLSVAAPTYPNPTTPITWAFDKKYLCPEDEVSISYCVAHPGGVVAFDAGFSFDNNNAPSHHFTETGVTSIAAGPTGHSLPGTSTVSVTGHVVAVRVVISGILGASPGNYELVVHQNATDTDVIPLTVGSSGFLGTLTTSLVVTSGDVLSVRIRPASGGARTPTWSYISVTLGQDPVAFTFDNGLPAGTYCFVDVV